MIYEACIENLENLQENLEAGANRIELCDNLAVGGTTPSYGIIRYAREITAKNKAELAVIVRPRGGDFVYTELEKEVIRLDLLTALKSGIDRAVIGALKDENVDYMFITELADIVKEYSGKHQKKVGITFHMAFDHIPDKKNRLAAIPKLKHLGIDTILTHGDLGKDIMDNVENLKEYLKAAKGCGMVIMPGGGITLANRERIILTLRSVSELQAIHGTKIVRG